MESFYSVLANRTEMLHFFVWFKGRIERSHSVFFLLKSRMSIDRRREKRALVFGTGGAHPIVFSGNISTIYGNFHMET